MGVSTTSAPGAVSASCLSWFIITFCFSSDNFKSGEIHNNLEKSSLVFEFLFLLSSLIAIPLLIYLFIYFILTDAITNFDLETVWLQINFFEFLIQYLSVFKRIAGNLSQGKLIFN